MAAGGGSYKKYPWWKKVLFVWTHDGSAHFAKWIDDWAFEVIVVMAGGFVLLVMVAAVVDPAAISATLAAVIFMSPVWLPIYLFVFFWVTWMHYIRYMFWFDQDHVLLEVQLPPEIEKSPASMEVFLTALWNAGGETTILDRVWKGKFRAIWSLEIASLEGRIHFYIHMRRVWRNIVEARLYGQFPEAKVFEVEDYVAKIPFNLSDYQLWGAEYAKGSPQGLPIRTYIDYGLHMNPDKPETQVDPITHTLELFNSIGEGQYWFLQLIIKPFKKDEWYGFYKKGDPGYKKEALDSIKAINEGAVARAQGLVADDAEKKKLASRGPMLMTEGEKRKVEYIERWLTKLMFEVGFRTVYMAKRDKWVGINGGAGARFFDAYRYPEYNSIGMTAHGSSYFDYPWQDWKGIREDKERKLMFFRYKHRAYFYVPYDQKPSMLNTEELATIWHFPSSVVKTPGLDRVPAARAEAPANLPV